MAIRNTRLSSCVWYVCASSLLICLLGNLVLFRSGFDLKSNGGDKSGRQTHLDPEREKLGLVDLTQIGLSPDGQRSESHFQANGGLVFEHSLRKLMEDNTNDGLRLDQDGSYSVGRSVVNVASFVEEYRRGTVHHGQHEDMLGCGDLRQLRNVTYIDSGWTKAVYKGLYKGKPVAIKTVDVSGQEVNSCTEKGIPLPECYQKATNKILKEIVLLRGLKNENVIKVLGYCIPEIPYNGESGSVVTMVTELGEPIDIIRLLQMWWEDRVRVAYDMAKIIHFLSVTPYGSLSMNDFRRQQFVLVNGVLKLSDVDDMGTDEQTCVHHHDCDLFFFNENLTLKTQCSSGRCVGYNEKKNIFNAGRHFTTFLLPHGAPRLLRPRIDRAVDGFGNVTMTSKQLLGEMEKIVQMYRSGEYMNRTQPQDYKTAYREYKNTDLPGEFDYRCRLSLSGSGCTISVFDQKEAEVICDTDPECQGFVMSPRLTWTGRTVTHLKSGFSKPSRRKGMRLFVRRKGGH